MSNINAYKLDKIVDYIGITLIGLFSAGYCMFENLFAELNIQLNFLDFPIFIGEILFFCCFILLIIKFFINAYKFTLFPFLAFLYFLFVLFKANYGYFIWGPLALRHSALFYYPLLAFFSFSFFRLDYFTRKIEIIVILILLYLTMLFTLNSSYKFNSFVLGIILIKAYPQQLIKYLFLSLFLIFTPYASFLRCKRTMWISNIFSAVFIVAALNLIFKMKKSYRLILSGILLVFFCVALIKLADKKSISAIIDLKENIRRFKSFNKTVLVKKDNFVLARLGEPRLYNKGIGTDPDVEAPVKRILEESFQEQEKNFHTFLQPNPQVLAINQQPPSLPQEIQPSASQPEPSPQALSSPQKIQPKTMKLAKFEQRIQPSASQPEPSPQSSSLPQEIQPQPIKITKPEQHMQPSVSQPKVSSKSTSLPEEIKFQPLKPVRLEFSQPKIFALLESTNFQVGLDEFTFYQSSTFTPQAPQLSESSLGPIEQKTQGADRLITSYINNFFRIFIWMDLWEALVTERPIFGFDFGKPFRSKSIEILDIAHGEWTRDGWIAAHNSYFEMIYRAGIIGTLLVITIFVILFKMIMISLKLKLINGVLLCAVLMNWIVSASFMPVLELPYKAIPFWSCLGMVFAYLKIKESQITKS